MTGLAPNYSLLLLCCWYIPGQGLASPAILAKGQSPSTICQQ